MWRRVREENLERVGQEDVMDKYEREKIGDTEIGVKGRKEKERLERE